MLHFSRFFPFFWHCLWETGAFVRFKWTFLSKRWHLKRKVFECTRMLWLILSILHWFCPDRMILNFDFAQWKCPCCLLTRTKSDHCTITFRIKIYIDNVSEFVVVSDKIILSDSIDVCVVIVNSSPCYLDLIIQIRFSWWYLLRWCSLRKNSIPINNPFWIALFVVQHS